jgi:hypothetical protein
LFFLSLSDESEFDFDLDELDLDLEDDTELFDELRDELDDLELTDGFRFLSLLWDFDFCF